MAAHYRNDSVLGHKAAIGDGQSTQTQQNAMERSFPANEANAHHDRRTSDISNEAAAKSVGPTSSAPRKHRVPLACKRCKRRKQRCDGTRPCCKSCDRVGVACAYEKSVRPQYPGGKTLYINALEERIAFLEARIPDQAEDHFVAEADDNPVSTSDAVGQAPMARFSKRRDSSHQSVGGSVSEDADFDDRSSLVDGVAYLSLCASGTTDTTSEPYYVGSSSGATIARVIQSSIFRGAGSRAANHAALQEENRTAHSSRPLTPPLSTESDQTPCDFPEPEQARMLFDIFFERIHTRWPILDRVVYEHSFEKQYILGALTVIERSIFHLIYAITARFLSLTRKLCSVDSERHLLAATASMDFILEQHSLATLQFLVLLGVHGQRSPYGAGAWSQIRYATSVCIEMGLHRKRTRIASVEQARDAEIRRRVFWACYCLDRSTSIVLGRAFAISDKDINVELPSAGGQFWSLTHKEARDPAKGHWSNVEPFIHIIKLDRINSRTHKAVFRVDRDILNGPPEEKAKLDQKMATIRSDLDEWLSKCPQTPKDGNKITWMYDPESAYLDARDFYGVQYHKAVLFLFTTLLPTLDKSDPRFITCAHSATAVCTAYKRLNQNRTLTYTMISLHSVFVSGLTLVYCIWRDRLLFSYETLEATRDCSQSLTIFGEKWPGAVKYRDIFDALSGSVLKSIVNPGPSVPRAGASCPVAASNAIDPTISSRQSHSQRSGQHRAQRGSIPHEEQTMGNTMPEAVKEAFMEVDGEAPGGWQGWRMWNDMMKDDTTLVPDPATRSTANPQRSDDLTWHAYADTGFYGVDPVQNAAMQTSNYMMMDESQWDMGNFR